jgi:hypothetical protein
MLKQLEERLQKNLSVEKLTCLSLRSTLREHLLPQAQGKLEMTKRLAFFFDKKEANADAPLLATDYIREDQDLSVIDREEDNDEYPAQKCLWIGRGERKVGSNINRQTRAHRIVGCTIARQSRAY